MFVFSFFSFTICRGLQHKNLLLIYFFQISTAVILQLGKVVKMEDGYDVTDNHLGKNVKVAELIWVETNGGSWWPAQVSEI